MSHSITGPVIQLYSGCYFDLETMVSDHLTVNDCARSLSMLCRFNGHCHGFYSVAEHCCIISDNAPYHLKWYALMHDCDEMITGDIPRPVKYYTPGLKEVCSLVQVSLFKHFKVENHPIIKSLDMRALATEKLDIMPDDHHGIEWDVLKHHDRFQNPIEQWDHVRARSEFLLRAKRYAPEGVEVRL